MAHPERRARPNVVLIMADQHRWDFVGYDDSNGVTRTPHLDRIGREGAILRAAYCPAPLCCPSRAAFASGRYGMNSGCFTNLHQLPPGTPSFVAQFREAGYRTAAIGKTHMEIHAYDADFTSEAHLAYMRSLGWEDVYEADGMTKEGIWCQYGAHLRRAGVLDDFLRFSRRWRYFMDGAAAGDPSFACHPWTLPEAHHLTAFVGRSAVDWLDRYDPDAGRPFLLYVGFLAPHSPTMPPPDYFELYRAAPETPPVAAPDPPPWLPDARRGYRAMITHLDAYVGAIRERLAERGLLEDTVIVYTADHGELAGDHGRTDKTSFFEASVRVPLLFSGPGIRPDHESAALVETLDVGRTLCDLCGVEPHALDQGRSLAPLLRGERDTHRESVYAEMGCDRMLRSERHKLLWGEPSFDRRGLGRLHLDRPVSVAPAPAALFDLRADPHEEHNLLADGGARDLQLDLLAQLVSRINENTQTRPFLSRGDYRPLRPATPPPPG